MIPVDNTQNITSIGSVNIGKVTATAKNIPFLINAVTDRIYKDKLAAIVREYSTNAWDAHNLVKKPTSTIIVTLPTIDLPYFKVRDFGTGLTQNEISDIYCILGESTKRESNEFNGQLGLGCKSAFGYTDSFTVTSYNSGKLSIYNIIKGDDQKEGQVLLMGTTDSDETGIEICIPIKIEDITTIKSKAIGFFKYWKELPTIINLSLEEIEIINKFQSSTASFTENGWEIRSKSEYSAKALAIMGQVAYPIDWSLIFNKIATIPEKRVILEILRSNDIFLYFPIGKLKFTINREELEYTETTIQNLEIKFNEMIETFKKLFIDRFQKCDSLWDAKRLYYSLFSRNESHSILELMKTENFPNLLHGNLADLARVFDGKLFWKNIQLKSGVFGGIHKYKNFSGNSIVVSFVNRKSRLKKLLCNSENHNIIRPFNSNAIVINDIPKSKSLKTSIAKYLLCEKKFKKVFIMDFISLKQKEDFFEEYHFESVPYILLSSIIEDVKTWKKANTIHYSSSKIYQPIELKYYNVSTDTLYRETLRLREVEAGGYFIPLTGIRCNINGKSYRVENVAAILDKVLPYINKKYDRIYFVPKTTFNAKWFQKSLSAGVWKNFIEVLRVEIPKNIKNISDKIHYHNFKKESLRKISYRALKYINDNTDCCEIKEFLKVSDSAESSNHSVERFMLGISKLSIGISSMPKSSVNFQKIYDSFYFNYPMAKYVDLSSTFISPRQIEDLVKYINMIDNNKKELTIDMNLTTV